MHHIFSCKNENSLKKKVNSLLFLVQHLKHHILMGKILLINFQNNYLLFSKYVVFGYVRSGQSVVDTIKNISIDSNNRPLKDVVIAHCGQLILDPGKNI